MNAIKEFINIYIQWLIIALLIITFMPISFILYRLRGFGEDDLIKHLITKYKQRLKGDK